jgi:hypothetical protein
MKRMRESLFSLSWVWLLTTFVSLAALSFSVVGLYKMKKPLEAASESAISTETIKSGESESKKANRAIVLPLFALIVSAISLLITARTHYVTLMRPFHLEVSRGMVRFVPENPGQKSQSFWVRIPLVFKNTGAMGGSIKHALLKATNGTNPPVLFEPWFAVDAKKWAEVGLKKIKPYEAIEDLVYPFIPPQGQVYCSWIFGANDVLRIEPWMRSNDLTLSLYILTDADDDYQRFFSVTPKGTFDAPDKLHAGTEQGYMDDPSVEAAKTRFTSRMSIREQ